MTLIIKVLFWLLLLLGIAGVVRTWQVNHGAQQKTFLAGTLPSPLPDGLYHGTVQGIDTKWKGKKFNAADNTGINVFTDTEASTSEAYRFATSAGKGLTDSKLDVLKIEYNIPGNPWWLRRLLDEIVQTAPDQYLGKLQLRLIPGYPFTLGYFELQK